MRHLMVAMCVSMIVVVVSCSGSDMGPAGGPVSGALDTHCTLPDGGTMVTVVDPAACQISDGGVVTDYGATMYNSEADDDDCKYHVKMTASPVYENTDVNFTVVATKKADGTPATGAKVDGEVFLDTTHPAPNSGQKVTESPPGTYKVGPIRFDKAGQWTVRFHLYEQCDDSVEGSPHGHAAFFIAMP